MTREEGNPLPLVLFSGTDDRLTAAAVLAVGAAAMGRRVHVFLQYWALDAFRTDRIAKDHGAAPEAGPEGRAAMERHGGQHWSELFRQAKEVGEVRITACALSMEMLGLGMEDLDPLVDGQEGVASFLLAAGDAGITFV
ncbi:MAG TPA: DsrE/DsrF/DrsH-like family protein [Actinomycetota bacterium]|nr:DsrE/DsrF/DrsH-like family protein [Actinomycetota bacterium]